MSSDYNVLCMNHDPAIVIDTDTQSMEVGLAMAVEPSAYSALNGHVECDLLVGRYSYPLIEVACPGCRYHKVPQWVDSAWLRLLLLAYRQDPVADLHNTLRVPRCWTRDRVTRLWRELDMERLP